MWRLWILLVQVVLLVSAVGCAWVTAWIGDMQGCILNLSLFRYCVLDSIFMTITASGGLMAAAFVLVLFIAYFPD